MLLFKIPGLKAALGIPDMAKIAADQAAKAGQPLPGQTFEKKPPIFPAAVFTSRLDAVRAKGELSTAKGELSAAKGELSSPASTPQGATPQGASMAKVNRVKRVVQGMRKMHIFSTSRPLIETARDERVATCIMGRDYRAPGFFRARGTGVPSA